MRFELAGVEAGVCTSDAELPELDDPEETETERCLRADVFIVMGSECLTLSLEVSLLDIVFRGVKWMKSRADDGR